MTLPRPTCPYGYTAADLQTILGDRLDAFDHWMRGQTMMLCDGRAWNSTTARYEPTSCRTPHGPVVYPWDLEQFLAKLPPLD